MILFPMNCFGFTAITSLKETVEGLSDLEPKAEILVRLLCAIPRWGEKNVQVYFETLTEIFVLEQHCFMMVMFVKYLNCRFSRRLLRLLHTLFRLCQSFQKDVLFYVF